MVLTVDIAAGSTKGAAKRDRRRRYVLSLGSAGVNLVHSLLTRHTEVSAALQPDLAGRRLTIWQVQDRQYVACTLSSGAQ